MAILTSLQPDGRYMIPEETGTFAADPIVERMTPEQLQKAIEYTTQLMKEAAKNLDFLQAAQYRDEIIRLQEKYNPTPNPLKGRE